MPIKAVKVCCQGCGADLQPADGIRFLTCNFCGSNLEIVRDSTTTHTRLLDEIQRKTSEMAGNLRVIELQNDLELLDRNWERYRESCLTRGREGNIVEPSLGSAQVLGAGSLVLGGIVLVVSLANWNGGQSSVALFWVIGFVVFGAYHLTIGSEKARSYEGAKMSYSMRRDSILKAIQAARGNH